MMTGITGTSRTPPIQDAAGGVTITVAELADAIRVGTTAEEVAEVTRLRDYAITAIAQHLGHTYRTTPANVLNEAAVRLVGYLYDVPLVNRADGFANAMRNSGAARMLLPYREHRLGTTGEAAAAAMEDEASTPAAGGTDEARVAELIAAALDAYSPVDQTARDSAAANAAAIAALPDPGGGLDQTAVDARVAAGIATHAGVETAHQPRDTYTLPAAAAGTRGGVEAVTNAIIDADSSTSVFGWMISHVKRVVRAVVPAWARDATTAVPENKVGLAALVSDLRVRLLPVPIAANRGKFVVQAKGSDVYTLTDAPAASATVERFTISFAAGTYSFADLNSGGANPSGTSTLTAAYPAGLTFDSARAGMKTGYLLRDPQETPRAPETPMTEIAADELRAINYVTQSEEVKFLSTGIRLQLGNRELADANQRDGWRLRLTVVS
ncbi:MAG: hypothetical protein OXI15_03105 [Chromatiales bacterium]|nr:hypothetical protein [Chromatiales bacterium]